MQILNKHYGTKQTDGWFCKCCDKFIEKNDVTILGRHTECESIVEFINTKDEEIDCPECNGAGFYEKIMCNSAPSNCCGGCYEKFTCKDCDGQKTIPNPNYESIEQ